MEDMSDIKKFAIIVYGKKCSGKSTLCGIIKHCLEENYTFRRMFADAKIIIDEKDLIETENNLVENTNPEDSNTKEELSGESNDKV